MNVNCLKFMALNIVSFLEGSQMERLYTLPIYLIRDLENFLKVDDIEKFKYLDFSKMDLLVEESLENA